MRADVKETVWTNFITLFVKLRECMVKKLPAELSEEAVADLHSCMEKLQARAAELEVKIEECRSRAIYHKQQAEREKNTKCRAEELKKAKMYVGNRRRLLLEHGKALGSIHMLEQQIDTVVSSHMDTVVIGAIRQYSAATGRLGLSDKTNQVNDLSEELTELQTDLKELQDAFGTITIQQQGAPVEDSELEAELEALLHHDDDEAAVEQPLPLAPTTAAEGELLVPILTRRRGEVLVTQAVMT
jgi:hypothetical protein